MKRVLLLCCLTLFCGSAISATLAEMGEKQAELEKAEMDAKIRKAQDEGKPSLSGALPAASTPLFVPAAKKTDDIVLRGIFGVAEDLRAEVVINNAPVTMAKGETIFGWRLSDITSTEITMTKMDSKKTGRSVKLRIVGAQQEVPAGPVPSSLPLPQPGMIR